MADVLDGYVKTRSGSLHRVPANATCDMHNDRPATQRVQGETDSFGCELCDMCAECYEQYLSDRERSLSTKSMQARLNALDWED